MSTSRPTSDWTCKKQCRILELPNMHELSVLEEKFDFAKSNGPQQSRLPKWSLELKIIFLSKYLQFLRGTYEFLPLDYSLPRLKRFGFFKSMKEGYGPEFFKIAIFRNPLVQC